MIWLLAVVITWVGIVKAWTAKKKAGAQLLDLGSSRGERIGLALGVGLFSVLGLFALVLTVADQNPGWLAYAFLFLSFAVLYLSGITRRRLTENGVLIGIRFVPWERIKSHTWAGQSRLNLTIEKRSGSSQMKVRIDPAEEELADKILRVRIPAPGAWAVGLDR